MPTSTKRKCARCLVLKPVSDFAKGSNGRQYNSWCKDCQNSYTAEHRRNNPDYYRSVQLRNKFKMTIEDYERMERAQKKRCAICGKKEAARDAWGGIKRLAVDHDRSCCPTDKTCGNCIRGLICQKCNILVGLADENPDLLVAAAAYLVKSHQNETATAIV